MICSYFAVGVTEIGYDILAAPRMRLITRGIDQNDVRFIAEREIHHGDFPSALFGAALQTEDDVRQISIMRLEALRPLAGVPILDPATGKSQPTYMLPVLTPTGWKIAAHLHQADRWDIVRESGFQEIGAALREALLCS